MRVLLIAEAANPEWVSVPLVGWRQARAIADVVDAHLVTQVRNRDAIVRAGYREGEHFTALDTEWVARSLDRLSHVVRGGADKGWTTVTALQSISYRYFESVVWRRFGAQLRARAFDVVHRLTPLTPSTPSRIARKLARLGIPFVIGPLNGGLPWPRAFQSARLGEREWLSYLRGLHRWLPSYRATRAGAAAILIGSRATWNETPKRYRDKCIYMPENGIDPTRCRDDVPRFVELPLQVAFVGRLVPCKGVDMLLEAAAQLVRAGKVAIQILGDGPERPRLEELVRIKGMEAGVNFAGWVGHEELQDRLHHAHIFGFPSIHEFGGGAVLEAMAAGLVPVVVDYGGPSELTTVTTGFRVPLGSRDEIVAGYRSRLEDLVAHPHQLAGFAARAKARALQFAWSEKARCMLEVYRWVSGHRATKPDFGCPFEPAADAAGCDASRMQPAPRAVTP